MPNPQPVGGYGYNLDGIQIINNAGAEAKCNGSLLVGERLDANGVTAHNNVIEASIITITLAASATTDGMDITFQVTDEDGTSQAIGTLFDWWISESSVGAGLTADSYSGDVTMPTTGTEIAEHVAKKAFTALTSAAGTAVALAVDSGNPTDQYVCAQLGNRRFVSAVSGTSWEGA